MKIDSNILWLGTFSNSSFKYLNSAESPAAKRFQETFIDSLIYQGYRVNLFSYLPFPSWPRGPFVVKSDSSFSKKLSQLTIGYINFPFFREISIFLGFLLNLNYKKIKNYKLIITYNQSFQNLLIGFICQIFGIKWISIFADGYKISKLPKNILHLSSYSYERSKKNTFIKNILFPLAIYPSPYLKTKKNFLLEKILKNPEKPYILYSGAILEGTGIYEFLINFCNSKISEFYQLVICGKGIFPESLEKYLKNKNVQFLGFISNEQLHLMSCNCSAFINPRLTSDKGWLNNFPSKLLGYLTYNSPTFSTLTKNLHPDIYGLLISYKSVDDILENLLDKKFISNHINLLKSKRVLFTWDKAVKQIIEQIK